MKLWIDDIRPAPKGYIWCRTVNEAKENIVKANNLLNSALNSAKYHFINGNGFAVEEYLEEAKIHKIELIDIDHDAGDYAYDGGDYIKLLDWLEETGRNYPIRIHSMNPVGRENMRVIIRKNGWTEVF